MNNLSASFREHAPDYYSGIETILISDEENDDVSFSSHVLITELNEYDEEIDILNIKLRHDRLSTPFNDIQFFGDFIVIGVSSSVFFYNMVSKKSSHHSLDGYFGSLHIKQQELYVCSASNIICFKQNGEKVWESDSIGVDGVQISEITSEIIYGSAECDPPDGWENFEISKLNGKRIITPKIAPPKQEIQQKAKESSLSRFFKNYFFIFLLFSTLTSAQNKKKAIHFPYLETCLIINEIPKDDRVPYEEVDIFLFEVDKLFEGVRYIKVNKVTYFIPENYLSEDMIRIELLDHTKCLYLLDYDKKVKGACYPNEYGYDLQWFTNGLNSAIKQSETMTVNIDYYFDESMENMYIGYDDIVLERLIDKDGNPDDFELSISYLDEDSDGFIERKISKTNKL
jgi:hypothetical protein